MFPTSLSLQQKIGQLICPHIACDQLTPETEQLLFADLGQYHYAGYLLSGCNLDVRNLIQRLQAVTSIPLFIAADIECGTGHQVLGATVLPDNMAISATGSSENAYLKGKITALEAKSLGINWAFAPVIDVNNNPNNPIINIRSFGETAEIVSQMGTAYIHGCQEHGVLATAKHFPGHGDTEVDSHTDLPVIRRSREQFIALELAPFRAAIESKVASIMTAHIAVPSLDPENPHLPATLSRAIMTDLLRKEMGFKGIIVTDALIMDSMKGFGTPEETALQSLLAGCDMVLVPPDPVALFRFLEQAFKHGALPESILDTAVTRILATKQQYHLDNPLPTPEVASPNHVGIALQMFADSLTLVKDTPHHIPLKSNSPVLNILINDAGLPHVGSLWNPTLQEYTTQLETITLDWESPDTLFSELETLISPEKTILVSIFSQVRPWQARVHLDSRVLKLLNGKLTQHPRCVVVSFGNPYLLKDFSAIATYACAYMSIPWVERAMIHALYGKAPFKGQLPVTIPL